MTANRGTPEIRPGELLPDRSEVLYATDRTEVFRARLADGSASVVCKRPRGPGAMRRLREETAVLARLAGVDGIPQVVLGSNDAGMIVLADVGGTPLAEMLRSGPLAVDRLVDLAVRLAIVLAEVHRRRVVHQDVNPANIVVDDLSGAAWLIDFDLATTSAEERPGFGHESTIAGTLPYLAPEQTGRTGWPVDQRADLYGLGATLYEMATGQPPFGRGELLDLVHSHLAQEPVSPAERNPAVPEGLARIILRLLEKEPDRRYQSADGLRADLGRLRTDMAAGGSGRFPLGESDFPLRLVPPSRLVGRDHEIGCLRVALDEVVAGRGRGLFVTGPPGVGKTALIDRLRSSVAAAGGWLVTGKFDQYRQDRDADAVRQALRGVGRLLLAEPAAELAAHRARLVDALGANAGLITAMLPEFGSILDVPPTDLANDTTAADEDRLIRAGLDLLRCVASSSQPLVLVLDDLQWAASTPLAFVDAVLQDDNLPGVLLVGTYRNNEVDAVHPLAAKLARWERLDTRPPLLELHNLPPVELALLLGEMLRLAPADAVALAEAVGPRTAGNPFDTVEMINAMRADGTLASGPDGWSWDAAAIRRYVGTTDVLHLLAARIDRLPEASRTLLEIMACIGGHIDLALLPVATGRSTDEVEAALAPPLEDGLLVVEHEGEHGVRFRHDRVQQAAHHSPDPEDLQRLRLTLARRFADQPQLFALAAEQYLSAAEAVTEPDERRRAAALMRTAAGSARLTNPALAEKLLAAATQLLSTVQSSADSALLLALDIDRHAVLCSLGRLDEADGAYESIRDRDPDPLELARVACAQIGSLGNRNLPQQALALGADLLRRLGLAVPADTDIPAVVDRGLDAMQRWANTDGLADDLNRPAVIDLRVLALGELINRMLPAAFFSGHPIFGWLVCEAQRLWAEHGPAPALVGPLSHACFSINSLRGDYSTGYRVSRRVLAVSEARGYTPEDCQSRFLFALGGGLWFEPLESSVQHAVEARDGLQRRGDLQNACWTYYASLPQLLDSAPDLDSYIADAEAAVATATRVGNDQARAPYLAYRQIARALRGETQVSGGFGDVALDETAYFTEIAANPTGAAHAHGVRALCAAVFDDPASLAAHAAEMLALVPFIQSTYNSALARFLHAFALAQQAHSVGGEERVGLLADLDTHLGWLTARAADVPANFQPMVKLLKAERAWALGDGWAAVRAFDEALREVRARRRPWQQALITERAARCHLAHGLDQVGRALLADARRCYAEWGAAGKVAELDRRYPFVRPSAGRLHGRGASTTSTTGVTTDVIDLLGVLEAARALSSETNLDRLRIRVAETLRVMTGATNIEVALWNAAAADWHLGDDTHPDAAPLGLGQAAVRGRLPLSAFRYAERTGEPLVVDDVTRDDRFAADPYLAGLDSCSLLVVPIRSQGQPTAMLVLENRLARGAFTTDRLDAVLLVAGQLAVCVDNALLYASLEQKVTERTRELATAKDQLEVLSLTDTLTGLPNRRRLDEVLTAEWQRARRTGSPLGIAMVDIDEFKLYNDHYGHLGGDSCLSLVAKAMAACVRGYDLVARYGGEEFCVVLPGSDAAAARQIAERIRAAVHALAEPHPAVTSGVVTVSVGVAVAFPALDIYPQEVVQAADAALYEAKRRGRNQVIAAPYTA